MLIFKTCKRFALAGVLLLSLGTLRDVGAQDSPIPEAFEGPDQLVEALYEAVTFESGRTPDWEYVRSMFLDQAIIVLRTSRDASTIFDLDGFVADFVRFIEQSGVEETGFTERIIRKEFTILKDIAHVLVLYEAFINGSERPPTRGVDSFQLIRKEGRWWIVSVTNEIPTEAHPVPEVLRR